MLHAPLCHGLHLFLVFVYPIVTVFSSQVLDTNTLSCVASSALYTLTPAPLAGACYPNSPSLTYYDQTIIACKSRSAEFVSLSTVQLARGRDIFVVIVALAGQERTHM